MSGGATCRSCGLENTPGRDFCERCGEYLSWAPTAYVAAVQKTSKARDETDGDGAGDAPTTDLGARADAGAAPAEDRASPPADSDPDAGREAPGADAGAGPETSGADGAAPPTATDAADGAQAAPAGAGAPAPPPPPADPPPPPNGAAPLAPLVAADLPVVPPQASAVVGIPEGPPPTGDASIVLAAAEARVGAAGVPAVEAGATLSFVATIRNESQIVDNYDLAVLGLPESWTVVAPAAAFLVPLGSGRGESDMELRVDISPPREYRSTAGIWTFELVALSRTTASIAARAVAHFEVRPFPAWSVEVVPVVNAGRLRARYRTAVRNDGNAEQDLWLIALTDSGRVRTRFQAGKLTLQAGEVGVDVLTIKPRWPRPVGRVAEHHIGIDAVPEAPPVDEGNLSMKEKAQAKAKEEAAKAAGGVKVTSKGVTGPKFRLPKFRNPLGKLKLDATALARLRSAGDANAPITARQVVFRQKPIVPLWVIGVILLLAVAAVLAYLLWPQTTKVPTLVGATDAFVAEQRLRDEGLVLSQPVQTRVDENADAGSVIEQAPAAGTKVDEGESVSIVVADGQTRVSVPRLQDLTRVKADERLRQDGLVLGDTEPADAPDNFVVRSQIPAAGLAVDRGTAVRVFLRKPTAKKKAKASGSGSGSKSGSGGAAGSGGSGGSGSANITIPPVDDKSASEYSKELTKLKLEPVVRSAFSTKPVNTVLDVDPNPGEKAEEGQTVTVRASKGMPPLAVEARGSVELLAADGEQVGELPDGGGTATQPSYFPGGTQVVYVSGKKLVVAGTAKNASKHTIYSGSDALSYPSVAGNGATVAMIRTEEGDGDLCFGRVDVSTLDPLCLPDDGWDLNGRISWRKDGRALLVPGRNSDDPRVFGVRQYLTKRPFSTEPLVWNGRTATNVSSPGKGVLAAAYSPDGKRVAAVSNLASSAFEVVLAPAPDLSLSSAKPTGTGACDVAWRPDSKQLAIVAVDDGCTQRLGRVLSFATDKPTETTLVSDEGQNPTYQTVG